MNKTIRNTALLALAVSLTGALSFAQTSGDAIYKAKCQSCHGASGVPSPGMAKMMGIKPVSDPEMKKLTVEQIADTVKNGHGKMKPVAGLSDAQVHAVATYFHSLSK